jgi:hypothetical protein
LPDSITETYPLHFASIGNSFGQHASILPASSPIFNPPPCLKIPFAPHLFLAKLKPHALSLPRPLHMLAC